MKSRAMRRHHEERIKQRVLKYYGGVFSTDARRTGIIARSRKLCSCFMCGNPRRWEKHPTIREQRALQDFRVL